MKDKPLVVILASLLGFYLGCHATPSADLTDQDRAAIQKVSEDGIKMLNAPESFGARENLTRSTRQK
jgi:hypothetical protein